MIFSCTCNLAFSAENYCRAFVKENRNFRLLLIAYRSHTFTNPRQNHRDFACPACVTKPHASLSPITVVRFYHRFTACYPYFDIARIERSLRYVSQDLWALNSPLLKSSSSKRQFSPRSLRSFLSPLFATDHNLPKRAIKISFNYISLIVLTKGYNVKIFYNNSPALHRNWHNVFR